MADSSITQPVYGIFRPRRNRQNARKRDSIIYQQALSEQGNHAIQARHQFDGFEDFLILGQSQVEQPCHQIGERPGVTCRCDRSRQLHGHLLDQAQNLLGTFAQLVEARVHLRAPAAGLGDALHHDRWMRRVRNHSFKAYPSDANKNPRRLPWVTRRPPSGCGN